MDATHGTLTFGATGLPAGLAIDPATGLISGTVAAGKPWLGIFPTVPGNVLIIDNELHPETIAHQLERSQRQRRRGERRRPGHPLWPLRGRLRASTRSPRYSRSGSGGSSPSSSSTPFTDVLPPGPTRTATPTCRTFTTPSTPSPRVRGRPAALVHHASKGNQSEKSVTDVGSGAGSISRAADTHLILRRHQEDGAYVLDVAVRSWPPAAPLCLRWRFPQWELAPDLDPAALWKQGSRRRKRRRRSTAGTPNGSPTCARPSRRTRPPCYSRPAVRGCRSGRRRGC